MFKLASLEPVRINLTFDRLVSSAALPEIINRPVLEVGTVPSSQKRTSPPSIVTKAWVAPAGTLGKVTDVVLTVKVCDPSVVGTIGAKGI